MTPCFAYLRVSGKGQLDGDGFDRQLLGIRKYAEAHGMRIVKVFREEAVKGKTELEDRPALSALFAALDLDHTKTVVIEKLDRLARDLMVQESIIADFQRKGFVIESTMEPDLCSEDPGRKLIRQILGAFAEYERAMIVLKLRGARERKKAKEGRCEGAKPYGHLPGEQTIVEKMLALRGQGMNYTQVTEAINREHTSRGGKPFFIPTVRRILLANGKDPGHASQ